MFPNDIRSEIATLKEEKPQEENVAGINCHHRNFATFVTFSCLENLFFNLLQQVIPATSKFF